MKYFLDTEFIEGTQNKRTFFGSIKETKPTIDLISIGIVSEDSKEYYAISKDFNIKEAWNRFQEKTPTIQGRMQKEYWIRNNVLKPVYYELIGKDINFHNYDQFFTYKAFKNLINKHGKTNKQIAKEVKEFCKYQLNYPNPFGSVSTVTKIDTNIEFYTYYGAYDWVVFCWLFGKMIDLPDGFPMFSRDLKVMLDDKAKSFANIQRITVNQDIKAKTFEDKLKLVKAMHNYPTQDNLHNALDDAKWNLKLYKFIQTL